MLDVVRMMRVLVLVVGVLALGPRGWADQLWTAPTPEELAMTTQAGAPGATAVYLYREETTDDSLRMYSFYVRLKVLTEGGKEKANVELPFVSDRAGFTIDTIAGRTIHPDGTIVAFTGKPYDKMIEKGKGYQYKSKVFTLPAVEVGSILEYRYKLRYDDAYYSAPDWYVQSDLYMRKAHYMWRPTTGLVGNESDGISGNIAWLPVLPKGTQVVQKAVNGRNGQREISLDVQDVPPLVHEEMMAPAESLSYRVMFYWTSYGTIDEYWKAAGKRWAKAQDHFIGPNKGVKDYVAEITSPGDTQEQKLKKIYDAVMKIENTEYTRQRSTQEEKAAGLKDVSTTDDVLARKRGNGDQLAGLFVAMARAAGMKAYVMGVANRQKRIFISSYFSVGQLDDDIAIVNVDGKDEYFDPGERYCEFKHVAWEHAGSAGLRETEGGTAVAGVPPESYKTAHVQRVADLTLDEHGEASGTVKMTYNGDPALHWRQESLRGDTTSLKEDLKTSMERLLPGGMEVKVTNMQDLENPDKPLVVEFEVKGAIGSPTGKRLLIQANLFQVNATPTFPNSKREQAVVLEYPSFYQDAVRIKYPATMAIESVPAAATEKLKTAALYGSSVKEGAGSVTFYRNLMVGEDVFPVSEYPELRAFYGKVETKDQEPMVLIHAGVRAGVVAPVAPGV